jgi:DNA polymerase-3 subunit delta
VIRAVIPSRLQPLLDPKQALPALCVIVSQEPLLGLEAVDALRARARAEGFTQRHSFVMDARSDWRQLAVAGSSGSLFGDRELLEISLTGGKPGKSGADALVALATKCTGQLADGVLTVVRLAEVDRTARDSRWFKALQSGGAFVDFPDIGRAGLPNWIRERLKQQGQTIHAEALQWLADRVEGNLLAAHQEIMKLGLLYPEGEISEAQCQAAVLNVARYDVYALRDAMLDGEDTRVLRVLWGLRAEGEALPLVLWAVGEEIRTLEKVSQAVRAGQDLLVALKAQRLFGERQDRARRALRRVAAGRWPKAVAHAQDIDRIIKGLVVNGRMTDPWEEMARLALSIASARAG